MQKGKYAKRKADRPGERDRQTDRQRQREREMGTETYIKQAHGYREAETGLWTQ